MGTKRFVMFAVLGVVVLLSIAAVHPLVEHWGQTASSGTGTFGSKWVHTGTSGVNYGLWGESASEDARGVFGQATTTSSTGMAIGVYGETDSPTGRGVHGYASTGPGINYGVTGATVSTTYGAAGVYGFNKSTSGVTRGVVGTVKSPDGAGVSGFLDSGSVGNASGVYGLNAASTGPGVGVEGYNTSSNGWAGYFTSTTNGVRIDAGAGNTGLVVYGGSKSASVPTSDGDRLLYSEESTEIWFSDYGFGQTKEGYALVMLDPAFAETVNLEEPYHVFLQSYGDDLLFVTKRSAESFEVRNVGGTKDDIEFSFRVVAKRLNFEDMRLEFAPWVTDEQRFSEPRPLREPLADVRVP